MPATDRNPRFIYSTECLSTNIVSQQICCDTTCGPVFGTCYIAKITGCIPYLISIAVRSQCGGEVNLTADGCNVTTNGDQLGYICCKGSVCVDEIIGQSTQIPTVPVLDCNSVILDTFNIVPGTGVPVCDKTIQCSSLVAGGTIVLPTATANNIPCPPGVNQTTC
ncbi:hypothetical protein [Bacillus sp. RIT694]|uniref:hypothetical protein n=1 Tax=Bacillus sp. RIT694 TaxID=2666190 RepID=UPI0012ACAE69|nr:hypothetical protein [Bacillus sp. RIT694]MRS27135.1 hypothetical protein [Bacillus sp. RIT694]